MVKSININDLFEASKEAEKECDKKFTYKNNSSISKNRACRFGKFAVITALNKKMGYKD